MEAMKRALTLALILGAMLLGLLGWFMPEKDASPTARRWYD